MTTKAKPTTRRKPRAKAKRKQPAKPTKKAATSKKELVAKTDSLSNLDLGETHAISEDEINSIIQEEEEFKAPQGDVNLNSNLLQSLTPYEYQLTMTTLPGVQRMKNLMGTLEKLEIENSTELVEMKKTIYSMELGLWNSMAKKFGYNSLEEAQENGIKLSIKSGYFIQATDA